MSLYDDAFFDLETTVARQAAEIVLPDLFQTYPQIHSVIDVGCGTGAWAYTAQSLGRPAIGVDHHVPRNLLLLKTFVDCDLTNGYPCSGFDLAICLEVAEHLPDTAAVPLVNGLARANMVLFSAATPGQPGVGHIYCQPHDYWHDLFAIHGYSPTHIGPNYPEIADFYQRNMYLYTKGQE